ncbi:unnamed protein product, partial [Prorocentrum cordatum]
QLPIPLAPTPTPPASAVPAAPPARSLRRVLQLAASRRHAPVARLRRLWLVALLGNVGPGRLGCAAARQPAACRARFEAPEPEARATGLNGVRLPDVCINSTGEHHVFVIGDWGGHWIRGVDGKRYLQPADNRKDGIHSRVYVEGLDDSAQHKVRDQMLKAAAEVDLEYVLNVGDNFYWSGVDVECGQTRGASNFSTQWDDIFEEACMLVLASTASSGWACSEIMTGAATSSIRAGTRPSCTRGRSPPRVASADGSRRRCTGAAACTIRTSPWTILFHGFQHFRRTGNETWQNVDHNICGYAHNPVDAKCAAEGGPESLLTCPTWFQELWGEQKEWLKWGLTESTTDWQVVVTHFPPVYGEEFWQRTMSTDHGIDLIVSGHLHRQEVHYDGSENFLGRTAWLVSGGGGGVTSDFVPNMDGDDQYGFMHLTLSRETIKDARGDARGSARIEAMVADWTLKPSLATYDMRPDREYWYKPVLESGQDQDGSLVALVEHQVGLAAAKLRTGEHKRAIGILRRAAGVAAGYARAPPGEPPRPVAHAALALIHLQHCVVLSGMGSHGDAAEEARRARAETDEVWRVLQEASAAEDAAVSAWWEVGPLGAAGAPEQLKALLRKPPPWLSMLVEVAIQSRQCLALELEYQRPAAGLEADDETDGLHLEAALLAEQLLPEGHPVRQRAAQAHREAELRREAAANPGRSRRSSAAPASLALSASFGSARASSAGTPAAEAPASGMPSPPAAALPSAPPP